MASLVGPDWLFWYPTWRRNGPICPRNGPRAPHTAVLAPPERLELSYDFRGGLLRLCAKGIVRRGHLAVALLGVTLKCAETRLISAFFRLHTGPGGLACPLTVAFRSSVG